MHTVRGDGVAGIKRRRRDLYGDSVRNLATTSGRGRLKDDLESSTWRRRKRECVERIPSRHVTLSRSSAEAEYRGVANVVDETVWLKNLLFEMHAPLSTATIVYCDNVSVVYLSTNPVQHQRTKHIEIDIHFVRDYVASDQVRVLHVSSGFQYADIFTTGLQSALFLKFRSSLNVRRPLVQTVREY
ncbi:ribonuclease H-like domain-containing protein [Tanacetum coccineum]